MGTLIRPIIFTHQLVPAIAAAGLGWLGYDAHTKAALWQETQIGLLASAPSIAVDLADSRVESSQSDPRDHWLADRVKRRQAI